MLASRVIRITLSILALMATALAPTSSTALASPITLAGEDGPVSASVTIYKDRGGRLYPQLLVSYKGYLYGCFSWSEGRSGVDVQSVLVVPRGGGEPLVRWQTMRPECYYHGRGEDRALLVVSSDDRQVWDAVGVPTHGDAPAEVELEIAFERLGQWDSRYGQNYRLRLVQQ